MKKIKLVRQHESRDCGAACLCMVCSFFGKKYSIQQLRKLTGTSQDGVSIWGVVEASNKLGILAEGYSCDISELKEVMSKSNNPIMLHMSNNHFVVATKCDGRYIFILDPAVGKYKITWKDLKDSWSGLFIRFKNMETDIHLTKKMMNKYNLIWKLIRKYMPSLGGVVFLSILSLLVTICSNYIFQMLIDFGGDFAAGHTHLSNNNLIIKFLIYISKNNTYILLAHMVVFSVAMTGIVWIRGKFVSNISKKIDIELIIGYIKKISHATMHDIKSRMLGDYMTRMSDLVAIRHIISDLLVATIIDCTMIILSVIIMYKIHKILLLISIIGVLLYIAIALLLKNKITDANYRIMNDNAEMQSYFKEFIQGVEVIKSHNEVENIVTKFITKYTKYADSVYQGNILGITSGSLSTLVEQISCITVIIVGFTFVEAKLISLGEMFSFYLFMANMTGPIKDILSFQPVFQSGMVALERLDDISYMDDEQAGEVLLPDKPIDIKIEKVSFHYPGKPQLFCDITFDIQQNDKVVIMGENGCGKSTLIKLIMGIEKAESGSLWINGININEVDLQSLRKNISLVTQTNFMFADTLRNNITFGKDDYSQQELDEACEFSGLKSLINEMPMGYETFINEDGGNLSGGQKQSIAIARALIRKPKLLILDEATSNMDVERELLVLKNISNLAIPCIIISHSRRVQDFFERKIVLAEKRCRCVK